MHRIARIAAITVTGERLKLHHTSPSKNREIASNGCLNCWSAPGLSHPAEERPLRAAGVSSENHAQHFQRQHRHPDEQTDIQAHGHPAITERQEQERGERGHHHQIRGEPEQELVRCRRGESIRAIEREGDSRLGYAGLPGDVIDTRAMRRVLINFPRERPPGTKQGDPVARWLA